MKNPINVVVALLLCFFAAVMGMGEVEARPLEGGSSFGMQRQSVAPNPVAPARLAVPAAAPKINFMRLQAANDATNLADIQAFVAPEVFTGSSRLIASAFLSRMIREMEGAAPEPFAEVWHLSKPVDGPHGWMITGIQQKI